MSKTEELSKSYSGLLGNRVEVKSRRGKAVITIPVVKERPPASDKQTAVRKRLRLACIHARGVLNNPDLLARYLAVAGKRGRVWQLAMADYLRVPFIHHVDVSKFRGNPGDEILITAGDDFQVAEVMVQIRSADNTLLEEGPCAFIMPSGQYRYNTQQSLSGLSGLNLTVKVSDLPGNITETVVAL